MGAARRRAGIASPPMDVVAAPAKLTVSLRVTGTRPDGYHLLDAEMVTLDLADTLTLRRRRRLGDRRPGGARRADGRHQPGAPRPRAGRPARRRSRSTSASRPAAGLGGGSADAAAVLRWAGVDDPAVAVQLGADVPFCLVGGRARVTGVGEVVEPLPPSPARSRWCCRRSAARPRRSTGRGTSSAGPPVPAGNDLEPAALAVEPRLAEWRDRLGEATGQQPHLAGSGSTWFVEGEFPGDGRIVVRTAGVR